MQRSFAYFCIVRSRERKQAYFVNRIKDRDHTKILAQKLAEPARLHKASRKKQFQKSMQRVAKERASRRVIPFCDGMYNRSFQKYGKICRVEGKYTKEWGSPWYMLRQWCRESGRYRRGTGRAAHKEGSPPDTPPSFLLTSLHSLGHSFFSTGGKPEATGSYAPSSWLAFTERLFVACCRCIRSGREVSAFRKIQRFLLAGISASGSKSCKRMSKGLRRINLRESENSHSHEK